MLRPWLPGALTVAVLLLLLAPTSPGHPNGHPAVIPSHTANAATVVSARDRGASPSSATWGHARDSSSPGVGRGAGGGSAGDRSLVFPPNLNRPPGPSNATYAARLYPTNPAPMGISDLGVGPSGPYVYGTTSFEATLTLTSFTAFTPVNGTSAAYTSPDWVLIQLDAVAVNVTLPPAAPSRHNGTFWVQNGVHFNGSAFELEDNIWNFSAKGSPASPPPIPSTTLVGRLGKILPQGNVYAGFGPQVAVTPPSPAAPLTIQLFDNITSSAGGHTVVSFGYQIRSHGGTYDTVTFNGTSVSGSPSQFQVNGTRLTPYGLLYDAEFVLGGNGAGANAELASLNGSATLQRLIGVYSPVPSAFDFGVDTGETSLGVAIAYSGTTAQFSAGPSFLYGLWNTAGPFAQRVAASAPSGWITVRLHVSPSYALLFATNNSSSSRPLRWANYSFAPTDATGNLTTDLPAPPGGNPYVFTAWADGWSNGSKTIATGSGAPVPLTLTASTFTVDAPVYLSGSSQAAAFGTSHVAGTGYAPGAGRVWINTSQADLAAPFLRVNDYDWPSFELLVVQRVGLSLEVNGFAQFPGSFAYTNETGGTLSYWGWTQGYFVYASGGVVRVENVTVQGTPSTTVPVPPVPPPATVEFYRTSNAVAANVTATNETFGVTVVNSAGALVVNLRALGGALGLSSVGATGLTLRNANATGYFPTGASSAVVRVNSTTTMTATNLSVSNFAYGIEGDRSAGLSVDQVVVTSGALALVLNNTNASTVANLSVVGGGFSSAGTWTNSSSLTFRQVTVNGSGLDLQNDSGILVQGGSATEFGSSVVSNYTNSTLGTFQRLTATLGATAVNLVKCRSVSLNRISATVGSVGAYLSDVVGATGAGFNSSNLSVGLLANGTTGTSSFSSFNTSDQSIAVYLSNSTGVHLAGVNATNTTVGPYQYFTNATAFQWFPIAGVGLANDLSVTVTSVTAVNYPFAVWANNSVALSVGSVIARYGGEAVAFNGTNRSTITQVFAFADFLGVSVQNATRTSLQNSTFEVCGNVGVLLSNTTSDVIANDNFVGNNGSLSDGQFYSEHVQAIAAGVIGTPFRNDYWADRGGGPYVIDPTYGVTDASPRGSFFGSSLEIYELDLPTGSPWSVTLGGIVYVTNVSDLYVPGWALANGAYSFVVPPVGGIAAIPPSGSISWGGSSVAQRVCFGTCPSSTASLPVTLIAGVGGAGAAAAVVFLVFRRRRRQGPKAGAPAPAAGTEEELPFEGSDQGKKPPRKPRTGPTMRQDLVRRRIQPAESQRERPRRRTR